MILPWNEVRDKALELGFDDAGVTSPKISTEDLSSFHEWLANDYHGKLAYMESPLRHDPDLLFPGAKTAIIFVTYYKQEKLPFQDNLGLIASYARGRDYHKVHRKRLKAYVKWLEERSGMQGIARGFTDSAPILEKALAVQAGLGWFGKNTLLIHRRFGTFILLSVVLTSLEVSEVTFSPRLARCGSCTRCIDACPTQALVAPYQLNATRCLSYHLIESKEPLPDNIRDKNPGYAFGCDICQDVCPHNVRTPLSLAPDFAPTQGMGNYLSSELLTDMPPETLFGTPLQRRGLPGLKDNILL